jgi:hypothetical protein
VSAGWGEIAAFVLAALAVDRLFAWLAGRGYVYWRGRGGEDDASSAPR